MVPATLGEYVEMDGERCGIIGEPGFGVPLTMNITGVYNVQYAP